MMASTNNQQTSVLGAPPAPALNPDTTHPVLPRRAGVEFLKPETRTCEFQANIGATDPPVLAYLMNQSISRRPNFNRSNGLQWGHREAPQKQFIFLNVEAGSYGGLELYDMTRQWLEMSNVRGTFDCIRACRRSLEASLQDLVYSGIRCQDCKAVWFLQRDYICKRYGCGTLIKGVPDQLTPCHCGHVARIGENMSDESMPNINGQRGFKQRRILPIPIQGR